MTNIINEVLLDFEYISKLPDKSIKNAEVIRQLALHANKTGDTTHLKKIDPRFEVCGLYPEVMKIYNILPEEFKK